MSHRRITITADGYQMLRQIDRIKRAAREHHVRQEALRRFPGIRIIDASGNAVAPWVNFRFIGCTRMASWQLGALDPVIQQCDLKAWHAFERSIQTTKG